MLGKLIKYDLKITAKSFAPVFAAMLIPAAAAVACLALLPESVRETVSIAETAARFLYMLCVVILLLLTFLVPVLRFRNCMVGDEKYVMLALPVSAWKHVVSKLVCTLVWFTLASVFGILMKILVALTGNDSIISDYLTATSETATSAVSETYLKYLLLLSGSLFTLIIMAQLFIFAVTVLSDNSGQNGGMRTAVYSAVGAVAIVILNCIFRTLVSLRYGDIFAGDSDVMSSLGSMYLANILFCIIFSEIFFFTTVGIMKRKYCYNN
jgi:hypothetical protein